MNKLLNDDKVFMTLQGRLHTAECPSDNNISKINALYWPPTLTLGTGAGILPHFSTTGMHQSLAGNRLKLRPLLSDGH